PEPAPGNPRARPGVSQGRSPMRAASLSREGRDDRAGSSGRSVDAGREGPMSGTGTRGATITAPDGTTDEAAGPPAIATARGLVKTYGRGEATVRALDGVDVDLERGRLTAIMGPSG